MTTRSPAGCTLAAFAITAVLVFALTLDAKVNDDEHVFIASAALFNQGYLPYRDFHYNHLPTMVYIYAGLFHLTDYLLLAARSCSAVCAAGAVTIVFFFANRAFAHLGPRRARVYSAGAALLLLFNPLFIYASRLAWNHAVPTLLSLLAFLAMGRGLRGHRPGLWLGAAGGLLGFAVTSRLTFAPALLGFLVFGVLFPGLTLRRRVVLAGAFLTGFVLAVMPSAWLWMQSPGNAYFGNFQFPALNTAYHAEWSADEDHPFTLTQKVLYVLSRNTSLPGTGVLTVLFTVLVTLELRRGSITRNRETCEIFALAVTALALLVGGIVPTPVFRQYIYAPTPFMILAVVACLGRMPVIGVRFERVLVAGVLITIGVGVARYYDGIARLSFPQKWVPLNVHDAGVTIAGYVNPHAGKIVTLAPLYALEGKKRIYPELATSRFGVRVSPYMTATQRAQYLLPNVEQINDLFTTEPRPAALLTANVDAKVESLLAAHARAQGYRFIDLPGELDLWVAPSER